MNRLSAAYRGGQLTQCQNKEMPGMYDAAIVGGGVIGVSLAWELVNRGKRVALLEKSVPGNGASRTGFAMEVSRGKTPQHYFAMSRRSANLHELWATRLGGESWVNHVATIQVDEAASPEQVAFQKQRRERLRDWGLTAEPCTVAALGEIGAGIDFSAMANGTVYVDMSRWYDARKMIGALLADASTRGLDICTRAAVSAIEPGRQGRRWSVRVEGQEPIEADWVINCAGPDARAVAELSGIELPLLRVPGLIGLTNANYTPSGLKAVLYLPDTVVRPHSGGHLSMHSFPLDARLPADAGDDFIVPTELREELCRMHADYLPALNPKAGGAFMVDAFVCVRPVPHDGYPLLGEASSAPGIMIVATHSGITLAPLLGTLTARYIAEDAADADFERFHFARERGAYGEAGDESMTEMVRTFESIRAGTAPTVA